MIEFSNLDDVLSHFDKKAARFLKLSEENPEKKERFQQLAKRYVRWKMSTMKLVDLAGSEEAIKSINILMDENGNKLFWIH